MGRTANDCVAGFVDMKAAQIDPYCDSSSPTTSTTLVFSFGTNHDEPGIVSVSVLVTNRWWTSLLQSI